MGADFGSSDRGGLLAKRVRTNPVFPIFTVQAEIRAPSGDAVEASIAYDLSGLETTDQRLTRTFEVGDDWQTVRPSEGRRRRSRRGND